MRYIILTILSALCFLTSCSVEGGNDLFDVPHTGYTLFEADFEAIDMDGQKSDFVWNKDFAIGVFGQETGINEKYSLKKAFDGNAAGEFYGPVVSGNPIMAYYPYSDQVSLYDGNLPYDLSPVQKYTSDQTTIGQFFAYAGYAYAFTENDNRLNFRYASGLLSVEIDFVETVTVTEIELVSKSACISGTGKVQTDMSVLFGASGAMTIRLDLNEGIASMIDNKKTQYPIVMSAGLYENITLILKTKEKGDIACELDPFEIARISAGNYQVTELVVSTGALGGFEIEGGLEFEPQR